MNEQPHIDAEARIAHWASSFPYPETPDIATAVSQRLQPSRSLRRSRLAWATLLLVFLGVGLMAAPPVRAAVLDFLQVGAVRIWRVEPTPSPTVTAPLQLDLAGETTLAEAEAQVDFPIRLPAYPPDLGAPDRVYVQEFGGPMVILVWLDEDGRDVQMSLTILGPGTFAEKQSVTEVAETTVSGRPAVWVTGVHPFQLRGGNHQLTRLVTGRTLIWTTPYANEILTYRLESHLPLEEAITVAESIER